MLRNNGQKESWFERSREIKSSFLDKITVCLCMMAWPWRVGAGAWVCGALRMGGRVDERARTAWSPERKTALVVKQFVALPSSARPLWRHLPPSSSLALQQPPSVRMGIKERGNSQIVLFVWLHFHPSFQMSSFLGLPLKNRIYDFGHRYEYSN